jgi:hypothetical protein
MAVSVDGLGRRRGREIRGSWRLGAGAALGGAELGWHWGSGELGRQWGWICDLAAG